VSTGCCGSLLFDIGYVGIAVVGLFDSPANVPWHVSTQATLRHVSGWATCTTTAAGCGRILTCVTLNGMRKLDLETTRALTSQDEVYFNDTTCAVAHRRPLRSIVQRRSSTAHKPCLTWRTCTNGGSVSSR
jgi:hypothetical protein